MKRFWKSIAAVVVVLATLSFVAGDAWARGGSFSGSRSSSSGSRSSSSSSRSGSSWSNKTSNSSRSSNSGSSTVNTSTPRRSSADQKAYQSAKTSGKAFNNRTEATTNWKSQNATKYQNKFAKEPSARPDYIPASTNVGGKTYNVTYNQSRGGYGYYDAMGAWIMYDCMTDMAMMSMLMHRDGYYYDRDENEQREAIAKLKQELQMEKANLASLQAQLACMVNQATSQPASQPTSQPSEAQINDMKAKIAGSEAKIVSLQQTLNELDPQPQSADWSGFGTFCAWFFGILAGILVIMAIICFINNLRS